MSQFCKVFNFKEPDARGRCCVLIYMVVEGFLTYITSGIFYTGFLSGYGIDIVNVGILSFVPYIASLFVIFTPALLNKFPKRRWILGASKFLYYFLILVGQNLLPVVVSDPQRRIVGLIAIIFVASIFNVIATSGYAAWHIRFQPEEVRAYYLNITQFLTALVAGILVLASGWITDTLADLGTKQLDFIVGFRYFAFALAIADIVFLLAPREVEYPVIHQPKLSDILLVPLKNSKFMLTMVVVFLWQFSLTCYFSFLNMYLLENIKMSYTFYNVIIFAYSPFFLFSMGFWQKMIKRTSWFMTFAIALLIVAPLQIVYGFVQPGIWYYIPLVLIVRLPQHFAGVGHNVTFANFQYINMPLTNRECYTSFYQLVFNLGALAGLIFGTVFTAMTKDFSFVAFGYTYQTGTPLLTMLCGVIQLVTVGFIFIFRKQLEPSKDAERA